MHRLGAHAVKHELLGQLVCALDGLHKDKRGVRQSAIGDEVAEREHLARLGAGEEKLLVDGGNSRVPVC